MEKVLDGEAYQSSPKTGVVGWCDSVFCLLQEKNKPLKNVYSCIMREVHVRVKKMEKMLNYNISDLLNMGCR